MLIRTEPNGTLIASSGEDGHRRYLPFGYSPPFRTRLGFTGQYRENHGYMLGDGYRAYHCGLMRFGTADRMGPFVSPDRHVYGYCRADPINRLDPSGRYSVLQIAQQLALDLGQLRKRFSAASSAANAQAKHPPVAVAMASVTRLGKEAFAWTHEGTLHIIAHGNRKGVQVGSRLLSAPFLASKIRNGIRSEFQRVNLYSCEAAAGSYLQQLADELRMPVSGSPEKVFTWPSPADLEQGYRDAKISNSRDYHPKHMNYSALWLQAMPRRANQQ
jgi:RHS repeat-associated protein